MKKVSSVILATIVAIASGLLPAEAATPKKGVTIKGEVISATDGRPIDFASVVLSPSKLYSMTDQDGRFTIEGAAAGEITVSVQYYGMEQKDTTFRAASGQTVNLRLALTETSFRLDNVVVVATANKAGSSTASKIPGRRWTTCRQAPSPMRCHCSRACPSATRHFLTHRPSASAAAPR